MIFQRAMGPGFDRLSAPLRRFHAASGSLDFHGEVEIQAPQGALARVLCALLGSPSSTVRGPIHFHLDSHPDAQTWVRHFPHSTMRSTMTLEGGSLVEKLGPASLVFDLREQNGGLSMDLLSMRFFGVPCPSWLLPRIVATETGEGDRLCFDIQARVPGVGLVTAYRGHLVIPEVRS
jgi:hypothetical protein